MTAAKKAKRINAAIANSDAIKARAGGTGVLVEDLVANKPLSTAGGSRWQEINIAYDHTQKVQSSGNEAAASISKWNVDFWIGSAGGSNEKSSSNFHMHNEQKTLKVEIGMKVTLVTVDRSSWFQVN